MERKRFFIELSYKGTDFHGWQIQPNALSVQECIEKALSTYFRQQIEAVGCGRTDTGVHASNFYAHFDIIGTPIENNPKTINGLNALLPFSIAIHQIFEVDAEAHARFDATSRTYHYFIHFHKDPFLHQNSWFYKGKLNIDKMNEAAKILLNYSDFSCFSKSNTQTFTNNCKITAAYFEKTDKGIKFTISANRFLRNMVRAIVGTLVWIGNDSLTNDELKEIIESKNRSNAGQSVPACGLYLTKIEYPFIKLSENH